MNSMEQEINLLGLVKENKKIMCSILIIFLIIFLIGIFFLKNNPGVDKYISSLEFEIINGENTVNFYQGIYHRITTFDDVASVLRSNDVLKRVINENNLNVKVGDLRKNIDLYEIGNNIYRLDFIYSNKNQGEKINISIIQNYLRVIESRMDNDNKALFDVQILKNPESAKVGSRFLYKIIAIFLFSLFCIIILLLILMIIKRVIVKGKYEKKKLFISKK